MTEFLVLDVDSERAEAVEDALDFFLSATSDTCECGEPDTMVTHQREHVRQVLSRLRGET